MSPSLGYAIILVSDHSITLAVDSEPRAFQFRQKLLKRAEIFVMDYY